MRDATYNARALLMMQLADFYEPSAGADVAGVSPPSPGTDVEWPTHFTVGSHKYVMIIIGARIRRSVCSVRRIHSAAARTDTADTAKWDTARPSGTVDSEQLAEEEVRGKRTERVRADLTRCRKERLVRTNA